MIVVSRARRSIACAANNSPSASLWVERDTVSCRLRSTDLCGLSLGQHTRKIKRESENVQERDIEYHQPATAARKSRGVNNT